MNDISQRDVRHLDAEALDRYRRRVARPAELLAADAHIAACDRCYEAVRAGVDAIELPPDGEPHLAYEELEAFVDGRADALDRELIAVHVASCAPCGNALADLSATRDAMEVRPSPAPLDAPARRPRT